MKQFLNLLIMMACAIILIGGLVSLGYAIASKQAPAIVGAILIIIPAVPTIIKWFKAAFKGGL